MSERPPPAEKVASADQTTGETQPPSEKVQKSPAELQADADRLIAEGKKAIALKQWEEGVAKYGDALDIMRDVVGEFDPKMAPLLLSYGKALYELAFSQQGVMGKEEVDKTAENARQAVKGDEDDENPTGANFVFAEPTFDGEQDEDEGEGQEQEQEEGEGEEEGEAEDGEQPEDDYNAAWEVLDVARTIYTKVLEENPGEEMRAERLQLADTYIALADVSCETENFQQAVSDYTSALGIQTKLLPRSSRSLASTHYQLATSLEFLPDTRADALSHVRSALDSFAALRSELKGETSSENESVKRMSAKDKENELKDVEALIGDLEVKIEELKAAPEMGDLVKESLDHLLGKGSTEAAFASANGGVAASASAGASGSGAAAAAAPVNDLTSMVRKKPAKKQATQPQAANGKGNGNGNEDVKRKAEEEASGSTDKKPKAE